MKKVTALLLTLCMVFALVACGGTEEGTPVETEVLEEEIEEEPDEETEEEEPVYEVTEDELGDEEEAPYTFTDLEQTMYVISTADAMDQPNDDGEFLTTFNAGATVDVTGVCNETGWYRISYSFSKIGYIPGDCLDVEPPAPPLDFFTDEERQEQFTTLYKSYQYSELYDYVNSYLEENETEDSDNAYAILDMIEPLLDYEDEWDIAYDDFDGSCTLSFPGATEISGDNSVVATVSGTYMEIKIGFRRSDWLFFDEIELSIDGERVYGASVKASNTTTNVISAGTIEEYCFCSFYDDILEQLGDADTAILRFSNKTSGETYDHTLSQIEKDSLYAGVLLRLNNRDLSNLLSRYNREQSGD